MSRSNRLHEIIKVPGTSPTHRRRFRRGPRPLQHPVFRRVLGVSVAGHFVRFVDFTIVAWLVVQQTDSSSAVGLLVFFRDIPFLILGPFVGALLDRYSRIAIFRRTQLGMAITIAAFGLAIANDMASLPVIYGYTTIMGVLLMAEIPSRRAYMSGIVGPAALGSALALDMVALNVSWFLGSNVGGLIAKLIDPAWAYVFIGAVVAANYFLLRGLPVMFRPGQNNSKGSPFSAIAEGFRFARSKPAIFAGLLVVGVNNFSGYSFESMAPAFAKDVYGAGPTQFGMLISAQGLGALITAIYSDERQAAQKSGGAADFGSVPSDDREHWFFVYPDGRIRFHCDCCSGVGQHGFRDNPHDADTVGGSCEFPGQDHGFPGVDDGVVPAW